MKIRPALLVRQGDVFLGMQYPYPGGVRWNLPGGNLEFGEAVVPALQREWMEELGVEVAVGDLLVVGETDRAGQRTLHLVFEGTIVRGTPEIQPEETTSEAVVWLPWAEVGELLLYPAVGPWLAAYAAGKNPPTYAGVLLQIWL